MQLTAHDLRVLHLASRDAQGRLSFTLEEDGSVCFLGEGDGPCLPAGESITRLVELRLLARCVGRSYVLTPEGWESVRELV